MNIAVDLKLDIAKLDSLPAMPAIAQKLLALALDTDEGERQLLKLIEQDPLISAKIIGLSNSAIFNSPRKVTSVQDAAMLLGLTRVKAVALGIATMSALTRLPEGQLKTNDLWLHSMSIAVAMRVIAKAMPPRTRPLDDQIFLSGLLHDIGYVVLSYLDTTASNALHTALQKQPDRPAVDIEQELLGMTHGEIGAHLGRHWGLPEEIIAVMRYHHTPDDEQAAPGQPLVSLVNFAERILPLVGVAENTSQEITSQEWMELGIDPAKAEDIAEQIKEVAEQASQTASAV
ncbi:MAG: HDOD domain-containing protein [Gallionella sp.]|nr:HDOD domain-containing protein [Gallionella sp.]MDD4945673.1 HDOD domain-containing protein [Gallionella sp.]MDD5611637.1 HDOD domain-containing protein [Gallionella sp.]